MWGPADSKSIVNSTFVTSVAASPCRPIVIAYNKINLLTNHDGTNCGDELFSNSSLFGVDVANV